MNGPVLEDHPVLGAALFAIGIMMIAVAYSSSNPLPLLILGHILAFNGVFWVGSGRNKRYQPKV
jgi:hypothetical protein